MSPSVSPPAEAAGKTNRDFSNNPENETDEDDDEFDLYPDVLELPNLRSPRGSINSLYGYGSRHGSRHGSRQGSRQGSNCSQVQNQPRFSYKLSLD